MNAKKSGKITPAAPQRKNCHSIFAAPVLTRGVSACLKMRIFASGENADPYPIAELASIPTWQWVMDDDFDSSSNYILVAPGC